MVHETKITEATHAWIKLHPNFPHTNPLSIKVEEGLCQLISHLFLADGIEYSIGSTILPSNKELAGEEDGGDCNPSDERLRQYFRFCIETDDGVYGEGFRAAAAAYAAVGMHELLYYVAMNHDFPPL